VPLAVAHVSRDHQQRVSVPAVSLDHQEVVGDAARLAVQADPPQAVCDPVPVSKSTDFTQAPS
jgi:hypothetical protein